METNNVRINHNTNEGSYECAFCHKKFNNPVERMNHERKCYATTKYQEEQRKVEETRRLAKVDTECIQKEYDQLTNDIKHHYDTYGESVALDLSKARFIDTPFYVHAHDPFWNFSNLF